MQRTKAPFRADEVGSLTAPAEDQGGARQLEKGEISAAICARSKTWRLKRSCKAGLDRPEARDRRRIPPLVVAFRLSGETHRCELFHPDTGIKFAGVEPGMTRSRVGNARFPRRPPDARPFKFLKKQCEVAHVCEDDDPFATVLHFRGGRKSLSKEVYPDLDVFYEDLARPNRQSSEGVLRRRLPLSAVRRHRVGLSLLAG